MFNPRRYKKALVAVANVAAVIGVVAADGDLSTPDIIAIVAAVCAAVGVYQVRNAPMPPAEQE